MVLENGNPDVTGLTLVLNTTGCCTDHVGRVMLDVHATAMEWDRCRPPQTDLLWHPDRLNLCMMLTVLPVVPHAVVQDRNNC